MRKDPPFDTEYIYTTYILERAEQAGALVVEPPAGPARHEREGVHGLVPAVLRADADHARHGRRWARFSASTARSSCKPLDGMGGRSIFVLEQGDKNAQRRLRDADRLRPALRHRAALPAGDRRDRRLARAADRRRAGALRAGAHPVRRTTIAATSPPAPRASAGRSTSATAGSPRRSGRRSRARGMLFVGPGRHRRLRHRDQRHQPHRHPRTRQAVPISISATC